MLIPPYYAASGGEYTQKRFNCMVINKSSDKGISCYNTLRRQ
ncbi:hypothetical protein [Rickettsia endosymbiont of Gonocerus acuteangulatus]